MRTALLTYLVFPFLLLAGLTLHGQTPTACVEIESILVDACGNPEGENEMVRFRVGPSTLDVVDLAANWPNNSWQGTCQNGTSANLTAQLNAQITGCGWLLEPLAGVLPPGAQVFLFTSTDMVPGFNSFANLNDTAYVLFQCAGNSAGHFANAGTGNRTLQIFFASAAVCGDAATYDRAQLFGGDGARADFTWPGVASYHNDGCNAPVIPNTVFASPDQTICPGSISLTYAWTGSLSNFTWSGGSGSFSLVSGTTWSYQTAPGESGTITLTITGFDCNGAAVSDNVTVTIDDGPEPAITANGPDTLCNGSSVTLTASGGNTYAWSNGGNTPAITVSAGGTYTVTVSTLCGDSTASYSVFAPPPPAAQLVPNGPTTFCEGGSVELVASGGDSYLWSTGATGTSITVTAAGTYNVTVSNACNSSTLSQVVVVMPLPIAQLTSSGDFCEGQASTLTASGGDTYVWSTGDLSTQLLVDSAGFYTVTVSNNCGSDVSDALYVAEIGLPEIDITASGITEICPGQQVELVGSGTANLYWSTGAQGATTTVSSGGTYWLVGFNNCGSDSVSITITEHNIFANFEPSTTLGEAPLDVSFQNYSQGGDSFVWWVDNEPISTGVNSFYSFTEPGTYEVYLEAENDFGCHDKSGYRLITVADLTGLWFPSAFIPDGDGQNDIFAAKGLDIVGFKCTIYNRWGERLHQWEGLDGGWDGRAPGGSICPQGVYVYTVVFDTESRKGTQTIQGTVTLIR